MRVVVLSVGSGLGQNVIRKEGYSWTCLSQGIILTRSNTVPEPSELRAQTGCEKGWKESAQQSNGVLAPAGGPSCFLTEGIS
jgi:hypothetical protein